MDRYFIVFLLICGCFLSGCGQTGDLYLPPQKQPAHYAKEV